MDKKLIKKVLLDFFKIDSTCFPKADVLTFACDNDRYVKVDGKFYSPLIDTLQDKFVENGHSCLSITRIASTRKGDLCCNDVVTLDGAFSRAMIFKRIKGKLFPTVYPFSNMETKIWKKIIHEVKPKIVIGINPSRELCSVCHENLIRVYDLQHGVISVTHPWYRPETRDSEPRNWLPTGFLVWEQGAENVVSAIKHKPDVFKIGNPWVSRFLNNKKDVLVDKLRNNIFFDKKTILVSLSWGDFDVWGDDSIKNGFITKGLEDYILDTHDVFQWMLRLHPNQITGFASHEFPLFLTYFEKTFGHTNVRWQEATDMVLPALLSSIDLHVTWTSSVCIEAAIFGVESLVLCPHLQSGGRSSEYYEELLSSGNVTKVKATKENIKYWVENTISSKETSQHIEILQFEKFISKCLLWIKNSVHDE